MPDIRVYCPICNKNGKINVSEDLIKGVSSGLLAVNISERIICEHSFIAYIDKNLNIRDYFVADFTVEIPEIKLPEVIEENITPSKDVINIDLIKLNLSATLLTHTLRSIFLGNSVLILSEKSFLKDHILNFFTYITQDSFKIDIDIISKAKYKEQKKKYKDHMVFEGNDIINNVNKLIDIKKLKIEKVLTKNFIIEPDLAYSYIVFKNEIHKAYLLPKSIVEHVNEQKIEKLNIKTIVDYLTEKFKVKLPKDYLNFIIEIIKNYFKVEVLETSDVSDFLGFI